MTKNDKPRGPLPIVKAGGSIARKTIEAPDEELQDAQAHAAAIDEALSIPAVRRAVEAQAPGGLDWLAPQIRRRVTLLRDGREEARAIMAMLDDAAIGNLRTHLKAHPPSPECVIWLLHENRRLSASRAARSAAQLKNAAPREFVAEQWKGRGDRRQSKASFARMVAPIIQKRFGVRVTPDRIARYWLNDE